VGAGAVWIALPPLRERWPELRFKTKADIWNSMGL
jgi:hypothetical protein